LQAGAAPPVLDEVAQLPLGFGSALLRNGVPVDLAEQAMLQIAGRLGLPLQITTEPYRIIAVAGPPTDSRGYVVPVAPGGPNVSRVVGLVDVGDALLDGAIGVSDGLSRIAVITAPRPPRFPAGSVVVFGLLSLAISILLGGGWPEMIAAGIGGCTAGLTTLFSRRLALQPPLPELIASTAATIVGIGVSLVIGPFSTLIAVAAGLIALLPGFALFLGTIEIARARPAAGLQRIASAVVTFLALASGVAMGAAFVGLAPGLRQPVHPEAAAGSVILVAYACYVLAVYLMLNARPVDLGWIAASCLIGAVGVNLGQHLPNSELGTFLAALMVGVFGQLASRWIALPPVVLVVPGTMFLLPGSLAFRGVLQVLGQNVQIGVEFTFQALLTLVLICAGLIVAEALGRPPSLLRASRGP
jgi:uncharacterized membrane protein YjjP (DUF1212 family)